MTFLWITPNTIMSFVKGNNYIKTVSPSSCHSYCSSYSAHKCKSLLRTVHVEKNHHSSLSIQVNIFFIFFFLFTSLQHVCQLTKQDYLFEGISRQGYTSIFMYPSGCHCGVCLCYVCHGWGLNCGSEWMCVMVGGWIVDLDECVSWLGVELWIWMKYFTGAIKRN